MPVIIAALLIIIDPNPLAGPRNDWTPLMREYAHCQETSHTFFAYTACTAGAQDRALHPAFNA